MLIQKRKGNLQRQILTALIIDKEVLGSIAAIWDNKLFSTCWANLIGSWCVSFYGEYHKAPQKDIQSLYEKWAATQVDEDVVKLIEKFLSSLSQDFETQEEEINSQFVIDRAADLFNSVKVKQTATLALQEIERGKITRALDTFKDFLPINLGVGEDPYDPFDPERMRAVEGRKDRTLIRYRG